MVVTREFDPRPLYYMSVGTGMGDRPWVGIPPLYATSHPGQLSLLTSVGRKNEYWSKWGNVLHLEVKAGWFIPFVDKGVGRR